MPALEKYERTVSPRDVNRAILEALTRHVHEQASHLDICCFEGEVVIVGDVCSDRDRQILLDAARRVPGVTRVQNLVRVRDC